MAAATSPLTSTVWSPAALATRRIRFLLGGADNSLVIHAGFRRSRPTGTALFGGDSNEQVGHFGLLTAICGWAAALIDHRNRWAARSLGNRSSRHRRGSGQFRFSIRADRATHAQLTGDLIQTSAGRLPIDRPSLLWAATYPVDVIGRPRRRQSVDHLFNTTPSCWFPLADHCHRHASVASAAA
jgi:hypothetical protein